MAIGSDLTAGVWERGGVSTLAGAGLGSCGSGVLATSGFGSIVSEGVGTGIGDCSGCAGEAIGAATTLVASEAGGRFGGGEVSKGAVVGFSVVVGFS